MATNVTEIDTRARSNRVTRPTIAPRWIRPADFAAATGMHRRAVYAALADGTMQGVQINQTWFIKYSELDSYFERNANKASA